MAASVAAGYRITFGKTEAMRFTGHLDLHRTWERTFRRAGLPLAYTRGFSPHPRINLGAALPLGCLSRGDLIDAWLEQELGAGAVETALRLAAPSGIEIEAVRALGPNDRVLQGQIVASDYEVASTEFPAASEMSRLVEALRSSARLIRERRGKTYDLRPLVQDLVYDATRSSLKMRLSARQGAVGRPEEVLQALGMDPARFVAVRTGLVLSEAVASSPETGDPSEAASS